jgi:hypothetical protein
MGSLCYGDRGELDAKRYSDTDLLFLPQIGHEEANLPDEVSYNRAGSKTWMMESSFAFALSKLSKRLHRMGK